LGRAHEPLQVAIDRDDRFEHGVARGKQPAHRAGKTCYALAASDRLLRECRTKPAREPDTEHNGQAAYLVLERDALSDQLLACNDQRPNGMGWKRLHMDGFEEAGPSKMCQPARIVTVGLVRPQRLQRLIGLSARDVAHLQL